MQTLKKVFKNKAGSALIGVVVIAVILSISALAYATLVRNVVSNEVEAFDDTRARLVAEAGLVMAAEWLSDKANFATAMGRQSAGNPLILNVPSHYPDIRCTVWVNATGTVSDSTVLIRSRARDTSNHLPYIKQISMELEKMGIPSGRYALHVENFGPESFGGGGHSKGLHHGSAVYGPTHANTPIMLSWRAFNVTNRAKVVERGPWGVYYSNQIAGSNLNAGSWMPYGARFFGPVTTWGDWYNQSDNQNYKSGNIHLYDDFSSNSPKGNNYSKGVLVNLEGTKDGIIPNYNDYSTWTPTLAATNLNPRTGQQWGYIEEWGPVNNNGVWSARSTTSTGTGTASSDADAARGLWRPGSGNTALDESAGTYQPSSTISELQQLDRVFTDTYSSDARKTSLVFSHPADAVEVVLGSGSSNSQIFFGYGPLTSSGNSVPYYVYKNGNITTSDTTVNSGNRKAINPTDPNAPAIIYAGSSVRDGQISAAGAYNLTIANGSKFAGNVTVVTGEGRDIIFNFSPSGNNHFLYDGISKGYSETGTTNLIEVREKKGSNASEMFPNYVQYNNTWADDFEEYGINLDGRSSTTVNHAFGFYSGGDIQLKRDYKAENTIELHHNVNNSRMGGGGSPEPIITAQLLAPKGKVRVSHSDSRVGTGPWGFRVHVVGAVAMNEWWNPEAGYTENMTSSQWNVNATSGQLGGIRIYHDIRKRNGDYISVPGVNYRPVGSGGGGGAKNWKETNIPR